MTAVGDAELVPVDVGEQLPADVVARRAALVAKVTDKQDKAHAPATRRAYGSDWAAFEHWCAALHVPALPASPLTVAAYAADCADPDPAVGRKPLAMSSIERRLAAITARHEDHRLASPCLDPEVRRTMRGIRKELGVAPRRRKKPVTTEDLRAATAGMGARLIELRDRALLLVGYAGAFRCSELVGIDVEHITERPGGLLIFLPRTKTDQQAKGRYVAIVYGTDPATCPVRALRAWLTTAGITTGPAFRAVDRHSNVSGRRLSAQTVALVVKRYMAPLGHKIRDFAAHSLRRGHATTAADNGAADRTIQATTGHASVITLAPYIEAAHAFDDPASGYLGL